MSGEQTAERFTAADNFLYTRGVHDFLRGGRYSIDYGIHIGTFKQALNYIQLTEDEEVIYEPWRALSRREIYAQGLVRLPVSAEKLDSLREHGDPIIHIRDQLELLRARDYTDVEHDTDTRARIFSAYGLIIRSVHGVERNAR